MSAIRFKTLGCKLNQLETESFAAAFKNAGFSVQSDSDEDRGDCSIKNDRNALLCVVNTCTVTGKAEQKARRVIRALLRDYPRALVLVTGCYAEVDGERLSRIDKRVFVVRGLERGKITELPALLSAAANLRPQTLTERALREVLLSWEYCLTENNSDNPRKIVSPFDAPPQDFAYHSRAALKIQDGCDNHCTYCRIRIARGSSVSLDADAVIDRLLKLERAGHAEVTLTGVNLSLYKSGEINFSALLTRALNETRRLRFRLSSLYPESVSAELLQTLSHPRIRPHFHLSVQSANDRILRLMGRAYTREDLNAAIGNIRKIKENPFISCDIIAGFPGETDEDFEETLEFCAKTRFAEIHAFPFSPRPGTEAFSMPNRVPPQTANSRVAKLRAAAAANRAAYIKSWSGKTIESIAETQWTASDGKEFITLTSDNYLRIRAPLKNGDIQAGTLAAVKLRDPLISGAKHKRLGGFDCEGEILSKL